MVKKYIEINVKSKHLLKLMSVNDIQTKRFCLAFDAFNKFIHLLHLTANYVVVYSHTDSNTSQTLNPNHIYLGTSLQYVNIHINSDSNQ